MGSPRRMPGVAGTIDDGGAEATGGLPNFVIVGAARSGSTSLYRHLRAHPEVFLPRRKELHYFDKHWNDGLDWYRSHYAEASGQPALGDATPTYMYKAQAVERMAATLPDARLVAILRNPVDRAYSHYWMNRSQWKEKLSFEAALAAEPVRLAADDGHKHRGVPGSCAYVDRGRYLYQLRRLCEHYPHQRLMVMVFEDELARAPQRAYASLCRFLGIDDSFVAPDLDSAANRSIAYRSQLVGRVTRLAPRSLKPVARAVARANERPLSYPPMAPETRARLVEAYRADNAALATWLGRDLSAWDK